MASSLKHVSFERCEDTDMSNLQPAKKARIHGVVKSLSPVKLSKSKTYRYFDLQLTDGKKTVRAVAFEPRYR